MLPIFEEATQQEMEILDDNIWDAVDKGSYQEKSKQRLKRFIKALRKYHHIQKIAKKSKITND
jgi:cell division protein FtsL